MPIYPYSFTLPPLSTQDIPNNGAVGEFLGISAGGVLDWLPVSSASGDMLKSENLSGLASYPTARTNLGLGTTDTPTFKNLVISTGSIATSAPVTISQTWDAGTNVMTALKVEVTDTASGTTSNLLSLDMSTTTVLGAKWRFKFEKDGTFWNLGNARLGSGLASAAQINLGNGFYFFGGGNGINMINGVGGYILQHGATQLWRGSADHILEQRNSTAPQTFNVYGTYTSGTSYERLTLSAPSSANAIIGTNKGGSGGTARGLEFQTDGQVRMTIPAAGGLSLTDGTSLFIGATSASSQPAGSVTALNSGGRFLNAAKATTPNGLKWLLYADSPTPTNGHGIAVTLEGMQYFGGASCDHIWTTDNNGTERMRIKHTTGNVGIGTTAPAAPLDIFKSAAGADATGGGLVALRATAAGDYRGGAIYSRFISGGSADFLVFGVTGVSGKNPYTDFDQARMVIGHTGNVGIGTTAPSSKLDVAGAVTAAGYFTATSGGVSLGANGLWQQATGHLTLPSTAILGWSAGANVNVDQPGVTRLQSEGSGILALRNSTAAQTFNVYGTYTSGTSYERLTLSAPSAANAIIGTNKGSGGGTARGLEFQTDGVTRMTIEAAGTISSAVTISSLSSLSASSYIMWVNGASSRMSAPSNGIIQFTNAATTGFDRLQFGAAADTHPAIARDGAGIKFTGAAAGLTSHIKVPAVAVLSLPVAATAGVGARAFVNDALAPVFGSTVATGGAVAVPVYSDGSAWKVG